MQGLAGRRLSAPLVASFEIVGLARVGMGAFVLLHALTYVTPDHPQPAWVTPLLVVLGVAAIPPGLLQWSRWLRGSVPYARVTFVLDAIVVAGLVAASGLEPLSFLFALSFPVIIEGAVLFGLGGSLSAAACIVVVYALSELAAPDDAGGLHAVALRVPAVLGVAVLGGTMARVVRGERDALRRSEARFRAATDHSTDGVVLLAADGSIEYITAGGAALLGRASDEALGREVLEFVHPDDLEIVARAFTQIMEHPGAETAVEIRGLHEDGSWRWLENRARNLLHDPDIGAIVVHTRDVTERTQLEEELAHRLEDIRQASEERRRLLARIVRAQEDERAWVADALHDDPIQKLTAAQMRVELVRDSGLEERERAALDVVASTVSGSIETLRRLMVELRSVPLERLGLAPALREHFGRLSTGRTRLTLVDRGDSEIGQSPRLVAYRIAQEAIANALKHAEAQELTVMISSEEEGLLVTVQDDGKGFDPGAPSGEGHVGLTSMRERADLAGGWCRIEPILGQGTTVSFWLPTDPTEDLSPASSPH